jgi:hypothetical protein
MPVFLVAGCCVNDSIQRKAFYKSHQLVKEIDEGEQTIDLSGTTSIILKRIPLGTTRSHAIQAMSSEGFDCRPFKGNLEDCFLLQQPARGFVRTGRRWIRLVFDDADNLIGAREIPLK